MRAAKAEKSRELELAAYMRWMELAFDGGASDTAAELYAEMVPLGLQA